MNVNEYFSSNIFYANSMQRRRFRINIDCNFVYKVSLEKNVTTVNVPKIMYIFERLSSSKARKSK